MINKEQLEQEATLLLGKFQSAYKRGTESARSLTDLMIMGSYAGFVPNSNFTSYFENHFTSSLTNFSTLVECLNLSDFEFAQNLCRKLCEELAHSIRDTQSVLIRIQANINDKPIVIQLEELMNVTREFKMAEIQLDKMIIQMNNILVS